jgi:pyruvate dehydrogenase E2 component (dihydrolipoamide acetyltransferase)
VAPTPKTASPKTAVSKATEFRLPELGENIEQGDLVRLMISPGAKISEGQAVIEFETE